MKKKQKTKAKADWFDTHVEVLSFGSTKENKKIKDLIKQKVTEQLIRKGDMV
tara:strand:- start:52 stop:207 length:156 start_codon:yes stop_codon:yes gene_type:complete